MRITSSIGRRSVAGRFEEGGGRRREERWAAPFL
jgi:hypothetical protein